VNLSQSYSGKRILITGGAGYLAASLVAQLQDIDCRLIRLDRPGSKFTPTSGKAQVLDIEGDIRDRAVWESLLPNVNIVFHFAAQTSVYVAAQNPHADLNVNVLPMLHLLETCRGKDLYLDVLFSGTVTEVGLPSQLPVDESHADHPITIYDLHKWMAENYLKHYARECVVRDAVLRLANVYGPGPRSSSADRGVLNKMIQKALNGETLTIYGQGQYVRDYVFVDDVARAFLRAETEIEQVKGQHFVIGSGQGHTIAQAINLVAERVEIMTGQRAPVIYVDPPESLSPIEARNFVADSSKFVRLTGWHANYSLSEGIDRTIKFYLSSSNTLEEI
jgi:UDP-glucose 4-epimerase